MFIYIEKLKLILINKSKRHISRVIQHFIDILSDINVHIYLVCTLFYIKFLLNKFDILSILLVIISHKLVNEF